MCLLSTNRKLKMKNERLGAAKKWKMKYEGLGSFVVLGKLGSTQVYPLHTTQQQEQQSLFTLVWHVYVTGNAEILERHCHHRTYGLPYEGSTEIVNKIILPTCLPAEHNENKTAAFIRPKERISFSHKFPSFVEQYG
ncbi:hypothetical protein ACJX0J_019638, partial [Zea mays]